MSKMLTTDEAAERLRVTTRTVYTWLYEGKLPGLKVGKKWLIREDALEAILRGEEPRRTDQEGEK